MYMFYSMNAAVFWILLLIVLVVIEILTMGLTTIWFAGGALVATVAAAFGAPVFVQITLFLCVSLLLLYFTRPLAVKYFNKDRTKTNVESYVGKQGIVISEINNLLGTGQVSMSGMEWSARTPDERKTIPAGAVVTVLDVKGVKLIVEERKEE